MQIPKPKLKKGFLAHLEAILGPQGFSIQDTDRISYSRDSNFRSTIQAYYNTYENFPSVIVWPENTEQVSLLIKAALKYKIAITPLGGSSGVCGGGMSYNGGMIVDVKRLNRLVRLDTERLFMDVESGISGWQLEKELNRQGFTLGHFPSSILSATLGGYLAARSAGQLSSKYGKIEDLILDLEFVDGKGRVHQTSDVSRAKGMDVTQMIVGSEGTFGIITQARLKVYPLPTDRIFQAYTVKDVSSGIEMMRRVMQTGIKPDVVRLYDKLDTLLVSSKDEKKSTLSEQALNLAAPLNIKSSLMKLVFRGHRLVNEAARHSPFGCHLIFMLEGDPLLTQPKLKIINDIAKAMDVKDLGDGPAKTWYKHRYAVSYKSSKLFSDGAFTDTMEVATTWDNLLNLYDSVSKAVTPHCLLLAHISHVYDEGAAIYFTFVGPLKGKTSTLKYYDKIWKTALSAVQKHNGVISHHHGIGRLKKDAIRKEWGQAKQIYKIYKDYFDPQKILNPGILT